MATFTEANYEKAAIEAFRADGKAEPAFGNKRNR
jgi:hypothetical protein